MKNSKTLVKTLAIALLAGAGLSGCIAVPVYDAPRAYGPVAPAIVVGPVFRPYYGGGGYRGGYGGGYGYGGPHGHYW
jgi:hypothetical protein